MTACLGIHISDDTIGAAVCARDPDDVRVVPLGTISPTVPAAVAAGADGAVLVGEAAADASGPVVRDPLARAARGRTGALTAVITHVVGRAAVSTAAGTPTKLAIVVPDDYAAVERDNVVAAANAAGYTDVALVPASLAELRGTDASDGVGLACGAARIGMVDAPPPIVTREDLGQVVEPDSPAPSGPADTSGPVSVFDEPAEPELPPVRATPEPVAARPVNRPAAPAPAPAAMVAPPPLQPIPDRSVPLVPVLAVAAVALLAVVAFLVLAGGDDDADVATATTTTAAPTTTEAPSPTVAETTTTIAPADTSSSTSTSTTSSTTTTTTTTTPVRVASPGPVTLVETGLALDTGVVVRFGQDEELVVSELAAVLGEPASDSGDTTNDFCEGTSARFVRWGNLELVFTNTDEDTPRRFTQWFADGHLDPTGLVTPEGLGESATVGFLEVTFPNALAIVPAFEGDIVGIFAVTNPSTGAVLNGTTLGLDPNGVVTSLWAGDSCTRAFT
ncbi:MAG: hypothetical protein AAF081_06105 [Actinomycetota bacterium]